MKPHWKILLGMLAGIAAGAVLQFLTEARTTAGLEVEAHPDGGLRVNSVVAGGPAGKAELKPGDRITAVIRAGAASERAPMEPAAFEAWIASQEIGKLLGIGLADGQKRNLTLSLDPDCARASWLAPFHMLANIFLSLLKMLIVPLILTSIVTGVSGLAGGREFGRLGFKTAAYYMSTSLLAILVGLLAVNLFQPGTGAELGLPVPDDFQPGEGRSFADILERMVPPNAIEALTDNRMMLQVIFFALIFGFVIGRTAPPHGERIRSFFESAFEVMMTMAKLILSILPFGVFALMARVVGQTGFGIFVPLLAYMALVTGALLVHAVVTLPGLLFFIGRLSPRRWFQAMSPALLTAFSTSSSSVTLPVTLDAVENRGKVSNKITSFTLPLGATINMDGTALYECVGVIFLSQYYASAGGFALDVGTQIFVVFTALLASIGAAGIPSAGLVMMLAILTALGLPVEGAAMLLAIDRPLDMLRTGVNVWSDSVGAALIARSEGEKVLESAAQPS